MKILGVLLCGAFVSGAWAATDSTSKMTLPEATSTAPEAQKLEAPMTEEKKITDLELRANAGSARRFSLQFFYAFSGPAINDLNSPDRPNPNGMSGDYRTRMTGSGNVRMRLNQATAMNFGTGMVFYSPWQAVTGQDQPKAKPEYKNYGIKDPTLSIDRTYKIGATQGSTKLSAGQITDQGYKALGEWGTAGIAQAVKWVPFQTRWTLGAKISWDYYFYAREYNHGDPAKKIKGDGKASQWYSTIAPSVEYKLTDNLNANTSWGVSYFRNRQDGGIVHPLTTMRMGVGWAIMKDIYFNPYIDFFVDSPALDTTSVAFNTTFSIF